LTDTPDEGVLEPRSLHTWLEQLASGDEVPELEESELEFLRPGAARLLEGDKGYS